MSEETNWVVRAEAALGGGAAHSEEDTVLLGQRPPLLDADGTKAVLAPVLAALVWGAAVFREMLTQTSLDPMGMAFRLIALGLTLRVFLFGGLLLHRFRVWLRSSRYGLVLTPEGLLFRTPTHDIAIATESVVAVTTSKSDQPRKPGQRWGDVYVVVDPALGRTHLTLPPVFGLSARALAEQLLRWRGPLPEPRPVDAEPALQANQVYGSAIAGLVDPETTVIHHDLGWLKKGPYAVLLVGIIAFDAMSRGGAEALEVLEPWMIAGLLLTFLAIPARWFWMARREVSPRKGLTMVLTPAELLIRTRHGFLRSRWGDLARVSIDSKTKWSVLEGAHQERQLVMTRKHAATIRYDEPYLGLPAEVVKALLDGYRTGLLPMSRASEEEEEEE